MKTKWIKKVGFLSLLVLSFFLSGYVVDLQPLTVTEMEGISRSAAFTNNQEIQQYREGKFFEAFVSFMAASGIDKNFWEAHYNCAVALVALGRLEEALHHLELSLQIDPDSLETLRFYSSLLPKVKGNA